MHTDGGARLISVVMGLNPSSTTKSSFWSHRLSVRTSGFHPEKSGSTPGGATKFKKTNMLDIIIERYQDEEILIADGFDEAVIGIDTKSMRLIYSVSKCIEILCRDMNEEDAIEYFEYNVSGSYVGEKTPIWCEDLF